MKFKLIFLTSIFIGLAFLSLTSVSATWFNESTPFTSSTTSGSQAGKYGYQFQVYNGSVTVQAIQKYGGDNSLMAYILNSSKAVLANASFAGDIALINYNLTNGTTYYFAADASGASVTHAIRGGVSYPNTSYFKWTGGLSNGADDATEADAISFVSLETSASSGARFNVSLNSPASGSTFTASNVTFNITANPQSVVNLTNVSIYIWNSNGTLFTTSSLNFSSNNTVNMNFTLEGFVLGSVYNWNALACGLNGTTYCVTNPVNYTFSISAFSFLANSSVSSVFETTAQYYQANITTNPSVLSIVANLWYNGTKYTADVSTITSSTYSLSKTIDVPTVTSDTNKTFFWEVVSTTASSTIDSNSSVFTQAVNKTYLIACDTSITNVTTVNFSIYNAINPNPPINSSFYSTWSHWLGGGSQQVNYSFENLTGTTNKFKYCIYPNATYHVDANLQFTATGYSQNYHYYRNATLNETTVEQKLYLLNTTLGTLTQLKVINNIQQPLVDRLIQIQLYDVGTGTYNTVGMAKTGYDGTDITYLNWYDSFYKFIIINEGEVEYSVAPYKISSTPQIFTIYDTSTFTHDKFSTLQYSLTYNNATDNVVLTYVDPTGKVASGCLRVVKPGASSYTTLYDQCSTSSSATLSYNVGGQNGTYLATFYAQGSFDFVDSIQFVKGTLDSIYEALGNLDATVLAIIVVGSATFIGLFSPAAAIFMMIVGMIGAMALGFYSTQFIGSFLGLAALGGYLIWKIRN